MLKVFTLRRNGFNQSVSVGQSFEYDSEKYVIIEIGEFKARVYGNPKIEMTAVCQKLGARSDFELYERFFIFKQRYNVAKENFPNMYNVGEFLGQQGKKDDLAMRITGIKKVYYEHVDLVIEYTAELIKPWSDSEISKALREEKLSKFKVISGGDK